ncbi:hypothetical protein [Acetobacter aceti]|uniref:Methyltransferase n=1 Tax=Acetobacter aceti TaxID=435 RepID=A0A6S6PMX5_ACEAC|nr:hypothetical protein [Acetobacter aceti]BCI68106.1 hypothetical protein AAJCM20276_27300 [Acetobacter aceti]
MRASGYERNDDDWYQEPEWATDALLAVERPFVGRVMDPCCGGGNIVRRLRDARCMTSASDCAPRWDEACVVPYQLALSWKPVSVISNPPYDQAQDFIETALKFTKDRVCVLLRLAFLEGMKRYDWFQTAPLARVWVFSRRVSMPPGGKHIPAKGGSIAYAWFVFEKGHRGPPQIGWLDPAFGEKKREVAA